jgi:hypothetical protein
VNYPPLAQNRVMQQIQQTSHRYAIPENAILVIARASTPPPHFSYQNVG